MEQYIKGQYRKSIFKSDQGYIIGIFKISETNIDELVDYIDKTITFTGYFHDLNEVESYVFYGNLTTHQKYGDQFQVLRYETVKPVEKDAIVEFLSSGLFQGIGKAKAKKIVKVLGKDTFDVIMNHPSNLVLIPSVTSKNADILHQGLVQYEASYEMVLYLNKIGFSMKDSMMIYHKYGQDSIKKIEENIYQLIEDIKTMTFKKIDYLASKLNIKKDADIRIDAVILYVAWELTNHFGHCYFSKEEIFSYLPRVLGCIISLEKYEERLNFLEMNLKMVKYQNHYYLKEMFDAEKLIASRFLLLNHQKDCKCRNIDSYLEQIEQDFSIHYHPDQKQAIKNSYLKSFLVITGGPGTGKTTILKAMVELHRRIHQWGKEELDNKISLLAPTGRAAKRMSEKAGIHASTIHSFLKWNMESNTFSVNEYHKSSAELIIIDEASMIDTLLFSHLLKGLHTNTKIILIGDYDQLPSVGAGQVLQDVIQSGILTVSYLKQLYRQKEGSNIIQLAYHIRNGLLDFQIFNRREDLTFIECSSDQVLSNICLIASTYQDVNDKKFQVLAPMYKTINGIDQINLKLQDIFNPKTPLKDEIQIGDVNYRVEDKVIQLTNQPEDHVYNGDIGIISKISQKKSKEVYINFDGNVVKYTPSNFHHFMLAYAISIHKAQGSEFDIVLIPIVREFRKMLYKKLIYTAVTRSKKKLYLVGDVKALEYAISNTYVDIRNTTIEEFLKNGINC